MRQSSRGLVATGAAFLIWGLSPAFWKLLVSVPAGQLLAHRVIWAAVLLLGFLSLQRRLGEPRQALASRRTVVSLAVTTLLISSNWLTYIWAILTERITQASLGYYINPLVTVLLGMLFLDERLNRAQWVSVLLAAIGVAVMVLTQGTLPWIALVLALTFGFYSLLRKRVKTHPVPGLCIETGLLTPLAATYLLAAEINDQGSFTHSGLTIDILLVLSGLITALPLVLFTYGARRLPLSTVGILQYSAPTLQFLLAVVVYREPFTGAHLLAFVFIWTALAIFTVDLRRRALLHASSSPAGLPHR